MKVEGVTAASDASGHVHGNTPLRRAMCKACAQCTMHNSVPYTWDCGSLALMLLGKQAEHTR